MSENNLVGDCLQCGPDVYFCAKDCDGKDQWVKLTFHEEINILTKSLNVLNPYVRCNDRRSRKNEHCINTMTEILGIQVGSGADHLECPIEYEEIPMLDWLLSLDATIGIDSAIGLASGETPIYECLINTVEVLGIDCSEGLGTGDTSILDKLNNVCEALAFEPDGTYIPPSCSDLVEGGGPGDTVLDAICRTANQTDNNTAAIASVVSGTGGGATYEANFAALASGSTSAAGFTVLPLSSPPVGALSGSLRGFLRLDTGEPANPTVEFKLEIKDTKGNIFTLCQVRSDGDVFGGDLTRYITDDTNTGRFDMTGAGVLEYRILNVTGTDVGLTWEIEQWGFDSVISVGMGGQQFVGMAPQTVVTDDRNSQNSGSTTLGPFNLVSFGVPAEATAVQLNVSAYIKQDLQSGEAVIGVAVGGGLPYTVPIVAQAEITLDTEAVQLDIQRNSFLVDTQGGGALAAISFPISWVSNAGSNPEVQFIVQVTGYFLNSVGALPPQTGEAGKVLGTDGTSDTGVLSWVDQPKYAQGPEVIESGTEDSTGFPAVTTVDLSQAPYNVPATATMVQIRSDTSTQGNEVNVVMNVGEKLTTQFVSAKSQTLGGGPGHDTDTSFVWLPYKALITDGTKISYKVEVNGASSGDTGSWEIDLIGWM